MAGSAPSRDAWEETRGSRAVTLESSSAMPTASVVEDLGSTNGTWVNDERLTEPRILGNGDELRMGQTCFTVELPDQPAATQIDTAAAIAAATIDDRPPAVPSVRIVAGPSEGLEITLGMSC